MNYWNWDIGEYRLPRMPHAKIGRSLMRNMRPASIGLDFGTESCRVVILDLETGELSFTKSFAYPHRTLTDFFLDGSPLPPRWALQDPADYALAAESLLGDAGEFAVARSYSIDGIGISFTSCTALPVDEKGVPLAYHREFAQSPHAFVKLWKHHAAAPYAAKINGSGADFLAEYGAGASAEWSLAKAWEVIDNAPEVWDNTRWWMDAGDWMVWHLTGVQSRSQSHATLKCHYQNSRGGYPHASSLSQIDSRLTSWLERLSGPLAVGTPGGALKSSIARKAGLAPGIPVAVSVMDAHAAVRGLDIDGPGSLAVVAGTSTCHISLSRYSRPNHEIESVGDGAAIPGLYDYFTGQAATGDMLQWLTRLLLIDPSSSRRTLRAFSQQLSERQGWSGLKLVDWWNGCRTPLGDPELSGKIDGLTLSTTAADIYTAMIEATAFGLRLALGIHRRAVGSIDHVLITGGLAMIPEIMQLYADVLNEPIKVARSEHGSGRGAAVYGALACGVRPAWEPIRFDTYTPLSRASGYEDGFESYIAQIESPSKFS